MIAFSIGPLKVYRYGIFYLIGFLGGYIFLHFLAKKKVFYKYPKLQKLLDKKLEDLLIVIILGVIIGGRLGEVLIYHPDYFLKHPIEILEIRKGGMSFIGGMIGSLIGLIILKNKQKLSKDEFRLLIDSIITIVPLGIMLGRIGNFLNQELYGIIIPKNNRGLGEHTINIFKYINIFHIYPKIDNNLRLNTNFLASFFEGFTILIILLTITFYRIKKKIFKPGVITGIFLILYSIIRFILEYFRQGSQSMFIGPFSKSQRFFIIFFIIGIYIFFKKIGQKK